MWVLLYWGLQYQILHMNEDLGILTVNYSLISLHLVKQTKHNIIPWAVLRKSQLQYSLLSVRSELQQSSKEVLHMKRSKTAEFGFTGQISPPTFKNLQIFLCLNVRLSHCRIISVCLSGMRPPLFLWAPQSCHSAACISLETSRRRSALKML